MDAKQFVQEFKIKMVARQVAENPNMSDMPAGSTHWRCQFRRKRHQMTITFSMGPAHKGEPAAADVLDCCASDAASIENARDFEDFAGEMGFSTDSRRAEQAYRACQRQAESLLQFLGKDLYSALLWATERL